MAAGDGQRVTAIANLTVTTVESTLAGIGAALQAALRTSPFANADAIREIQIIRNKNSNDCTAFIIWENAA